MTRWLVALLVLAPASSAAGAYNWDLQRRVDRMDGIEHVYISVTADEFYPNDIRPQLASLRIQCTKGRAELVVHTETILQNNTGDIGRHRMRVRLDDGKPETVTASEATDHTSLFIPNPKPLLRRLLHAKVAYMEVVPYRHGPATVAFRVDGLDRFSTTLATDCGVK